MSKRGALQRWREQISKRIHVAWVFVKASALHCRVFGHEWQPWRIWGAAYDIRECAWCGLTEQRRAHTFARVRRKRDLRDNRVRGITRNEDPRKRPTDEGRRVVHRDSASSFSSEGWRTK